jgi:hypothetical protein
MADSRIITAWESAGCDERAEFIKYLREHYGDNLNKFMDCEDKK